MLVSRLLQQQMAPKLGRCGVVRDDGDNLILAARANASQVHTVLQTLCIKKKEGTKQEICVRASALCLGPLARGGTSAFSQITMGDPSAGASMATPIGKGMTRWPTKVDQRVAAFFFFLHKHGEACRQKPH